VLATFQKTPLHTWKEENTGFAEFSFHDILPTQMKEIFPQTTKEVVKT
jgi:hypothetical protein